MSEVYSYNSNQPVVGKFDSKVMQYDPSKQSVLGNFTQKSCTMTLPYGLCCCRAPWSLRFCILAHTYADSGQSGRSTRCRLFPRASMPCCSQRTPGSNTSRVRTAVPRARTPVLCMNAFLPHPRLEHQRGTVTSTPCSNRSNSNRHEWVLTPPWARILV